MPATAARAERLPAAAASSSRCRLAATSANSAATKNALQGQQEHRDDQASSVLTPRPLLRPQTGTWRSMVVDRQPDELGRRPAAVGSDAVPRSTMSSSPSAGIRPSRAMTRPDKVS